MKKKLSDINALAVEITLASLFAVMLSFSDRVAEAEPGPVLTFEPGSLIIPMDLAYQDSGLLQAFGLVFQLLRQNVRVYWIIDSAKTWHDAACDTAGDECEWDCAEEDSGTKCSYPTASPDFYATTTVLWDSEGALAPGTAIDSHGYRGGPFVVDAADRERAMAIIDAWNDPSIWSENPWAERTIFHVVSVHEATAPFQGEAKKEMVAAPTIAVFSDGNENIATAYLRAAGIPQSNGSEFPAAKCAEGGCGAGTENPDMLTVPSVAGDMGTCDEPNKDHMDGQLFSGGIPAYCQIMSMHWDVNDRETVRCGGGACPDTAEECAGEPITYHGHEVVAEVRAFLDFSVHFFAECQAVNAYENTVPNPAWPFLDDELRNGHFLTTVGVLPDCGDGNTCDVEELGCEPLGCDDGTRDCCVPTDVKERGAGFFISAQPASEDVQILHPEVPYNQLDGAFGTVGGSEPAYDLATELGVRYVNDRNVTFITGPSGPGAQDVWMTGYKDGECDIVLLFRDDGDCTNGKVSYLGGHAYKTDVPVSRNPDTQGTRLFLNALFEADCVTTVGQPIMAVTLTGPTSLPVEAAQGLYDIAYGNTGQGTALDGELRLDLPDGVTVVDAGGGTVSGSRVTFEVGSIGTLGGPGLAPSAGTYTVELAFEGEGGYVLSARLGYRVGATTMEAGPVELGVGVGVAPPDTGVDTADTSVDGAGDAGDVDGDGVPVSSSGGCGCRVAPASGTSPAIVLLVLLALLALRRRGRGRPT